MADTFPRQLARTRRFSLGEPKAFTIAPDGTRITFLRSLNGSDPVNRLWIAERSNTDLARDSKWTERLVCDPTTLFGGGVTDSDLPPAEQARRERLREQANGITAYVTDSELTTAVFTLAGHVLAADLFTGTTQVLETSPGAYDPHISPDGQHVAYVCDRTLCVRTLPGKGDAEGNVERILATDADPNVRWGSADFNAAEEFNRYRGYWWSPDSAYIVAAKVDDTPVATWHIADPANPQREANVHRYPAAGTANAIVTLAVIDVATGAHVAVAADHANLPYLIAVQWTAAGLFATWLDRAQTRLITQRIDLATGSVAVLHEVTDDVWVELMVGTPIVSKDGSSITSIDTHVDSTTTPAGVASPSERGEYDDPEGTRALVQIKPDGTRRVLTPPNLQVRRLVHSSDSSLVFTANASRNIPTLSIDADPAQQAVLRLDRSSGVLSVLAGSSTDPGIHDVAAMLSPLPESADLPELIVLRSVSVDRLRADLTIQRVQATGDALGLAQEHHFDNQAEVSLADPKPFFFRAGPRALPVCVFTPTTPEQFGDEFTKLPVLMDPYGGPHAQRVVHARNAHASSQWFADQGFIVVVVDGRGTPGLGPVFERAVHHNFADPVLEDQVTGLLAAAERYPQMDLGRVGIRGWSFGGYLSALAVLKRPDVFHAGVAGAPVTEWRLYDTGYTERYLGTPQDNKHAYDVSGLLPLAKNLQRPLMLIHGLADDNVVAAHTLQLSNELLAHGRPHEVLPLSGVTHMTPQESVAENLLKLQVEFLRRHLANPQPLG